EFSLSLASWDKAAEKMSQFHQTYDFYITPAAASTAPKIGELTPSQKDVTQIGEEIMSASPNKQQEIIYDMFLPSLTYTPFTQLAINGLLIGVQVMARKGGEASLLKLAAQLEKSPLWVGTDELLR